MPIISAEIAKAHLRIDGNAHDTILPLYIGAAEQSAADYLNRALFADQAELAAAIVAVPAALAVATAAYSTAIEAALLLTDVLEQAAAKVAAENVYTDAQTRARETRFGMVANDAIRAAVLLTLGDLHSSREDTVIGVSVASLPTGARALLQPYRRGMGV